MECFESPLGAEVEGTDDSASDFDKKDMQKRRW
jgi:hypothetical protein